MDSFYEHLEEDKQASKEYKEETWESAELLLDQIYQAMNRLPNTKIPNSPDFQDTYHIATAISNYFKYK